MITRRGFLKMNAVLGATVAVDADHLSRALAGRYFDFGMVLPAIPRVDETVLIALTGPRLAHCIGGLVIAAGTAPSDAEALLRFVDGVNGARSVPVLKALWPVSSEGGSEVFHNTGRPVAGWEVRRSAPEGDAVKWWSHLLDAVSRSGVWNLHLRDGALDQVEPLATALGYFPHLSVLVHSAPAFSASLRSLVATLDGNALAAVVSSEPVARATSAWGSGLSPWHPARPDVRSHALMLKIATAHGFRAWPANDEVT